MRRAAREWLLVFHTLYCILYTLEPRAKEWLLIFHTLGLCTLYSALNVEEVSARQLLDFLTRVKVRKADHTLSAPGL